MNPVSAGDQPVAVGEGCVSFARPNWHDDCDHLPGCVALDGLADINQLQGNAACSSHDRASRITLQASELPLPMSQVTIPDPTTDTSHPPGPRKTVSRRVVIYDGLDMDGSGRAIERWSSPTANVTTIKDHQLRGVADLRSDLSIRLHRVKIRGPVRPSIRRILAPIKPGRTSGGYPFECDQIPLPLKLAIADPSHSCRLSVNHLHPRVGGLVRE